MKLITFPELNNSRCKMGRSSSQHLFVFVLRLEQNLSFIPWLCVLPPATLTSRVLLILTGVSSLSFTLSRHVTVSLSQSVAVSNPKQVQLIHNKNASTPTSPTSPTSPAGPAGAAATWTDNKGADKGTALLSPGPEPGKDLFNMKPWVTCQFHSAHRKQTWHVTCTSNMGQWVNTCVHWLTFKDLKWNNLFLCMWQTKLWTQTSADLSVNTCM